MCQRTLALPVRVQSGVQARSGVLGLPRRRQKRSFPPPPSADRHPLAAGRLLL